MSNRSSEDKIGLRRTRDRKRRRLNRPGVMAVAKIVVALAVAGMVVWAVGSAAFGPTYGPGPAREQAASGGPAGAAPTSTAGCDASIGDVVELGRDDMGTVPVANTERALDRMIESVVANDTVGFGLEMLAGATPVGAGTEARVLNVGFSRLKVRVTEGRKRGRAGWVADEWIRCSTGSA